MKSKIIALSAVSAGLISVFLTLGAYIELIDLVCIVIASAFVILPIYYKSYSGSFLAFLAGGVISFVFSGFNILSIVFPSYLMFFGCFPIAKLKMREKNFNKIIGVIIGIIWCVATFYAMYFYYTGVMKLELKDLPKFISDYILYFVGAFGIVFYVIYDRYVVVLKITFDKYLKRIIK